MIDIHTHLHPERLRRAIRRWFADNSPWRLTHPDTPEDVRAEMQRQGVTKFVFCSYAHKPGIARGINEWLIETKNELGGNALALFTVHLEDRDYFEDAKRALDAGCVGIKIHEDVQQLSINDPRFEPVFDAVERRGGFVLVHVGPIPWQVIPETGVNRVRAVKEQFPRLKIVVAHMGIPDTESYFSLMDRTSDLYIDTTMGFSNIAGLKATIDDDSLEKYSHRILFGSDYPNVPYEYDLEPKILRSRKISAGALSRIFRDNATNLLAPFCN